MLIVGLTGGIGCGKSTVESRFIQHGVPVVDADDIAHHLVKPGQPALAAVVARFGDQILTESGEMDRNRMRQIAFQDSQAKNDLEAILHPLVYAEIFKRLSMTDAPYGIASVPLLIETGHQDRVDRILVIDCDPERQKQRIRQRDQLDDEVIDRIIASQCSRDQRLLLATDVIENNGDLASLYKQVDYQHEHFLTLAKDID